MRKIQKDLEKTHKVEAIKENGMPDIYVYRTLKNVGKMGLAAMVVVHGGGGVTGNGLSNHYVLNNLTMDNDLVVIRLSYALAPKYKMPA